MSFDTNTIDWVHLKELKDSREVCLVDLRQPKEVDETGKVPNAINIPLDTLENVLNLPPEEFETAYDRPKPDLDALMIFLFEAGGKETQAETIALETGYTNIKNYKGTWADWQKHLAK